MINIFVSLTNPFSKKFDNVYCKVFRLSKYKFAEFEVVRDTVIISFSLKINPRRDHGGICIDFGLLSWGVSFNIYDSRHWDYDTDTWEVYDDTEEKNN